MTLLEARDRGADAPPPWLERLALAIPDGVAWIVDGRITWANDRLVELAGRGTALVGAKLEELLVDTGEGLPGPGRPHVVNCEMLRPGGDCRTVVCRSAWRDPERRTRATVIHDVTHVRRVEEELLHTGHELARLHRELETQREHLRRERAEREELLNVVSHELRTPVTVIGGYNKLLLSEDIGPLNDEQRKFLEESRRSCRRLDTFIENLLQASGASKGAEVLEVGQGPLAAVIEGIATMFAPMLEERRQVLSLSLDPNAATARFDRMRLEQILTNLVGNALKFTPEGGQLQLATRALERPEDPWVRHWVEIEVSDDGPGVPIEDRARVFEPYVQAGGERSGGGLGLGLAISKRLVEAHGGSIRLDEVAGGGCRVHFTLPAEEASRSDRRESR